MAGTYSIHSKQSLVVITRTDRVGSEDWEIFMDRLLSDPAFQPGLHLVDDRRQVADTPQRSEVERAARWIQDHSARLGTIRWAIVVDPSSLAAFGMARVIEALTSRTPVTVRAHTDLPAAMAWAAGRAQEV
jgi:hypothetical protein